MKNTIIFVLILVIIGGAVYFNSNKDKELVENNVPEEQITEGNVMYEDMEHGFSFEYPEELSLEKTSEGLVRITSVPIPEVSVEECNAFEDEQARAICLDPASLLSPNIVIVFLGGDAEVLWEDATFSPVDGEAFNTEHHTWNRNNIGTEFGGVEMYGLFTEEGLLLASYKYKDSDGGAPFSAVESAKYQLDKNQQKELLEEILSTFKY